MKKNLGALLIIGLVVALLASCGPQATPTPAPTQPPAAPTATKAPASSAAPVTAAPSPAATKPRVEFKISFLAGRPDSAEFALTHGLSQLINKNSAWLRAQVTETPGMAANYELVVKKPEMKLNSIICGMASVSNSAEKSAAESGLPWSPYKDSRFVARFNATSHPYVTLDKNIKAFADLKGKRVFEGRKEASRWLDTEKIFIEAGIRDAVKFSNGSFGEGATALRDGLVDAAVQQLTVSVDHKNFILDAPLQELMASKTVYFVSYDKDAFDRAVKNYNLGVYPIIVPKGTMGETQTEPLVSKYDASYLLADKTMDPEVAYELVRILDENVGKLAEFHVTGKWVTRDTIGTSGYLPLEEYHPGAMKYFKEKGIKVAVR